MRRRRFLQTLGGAAVLPWAGGVLPVLAQAPAAPAPPAPAATPPAAPAVDPGIAADARTLVDLVKRRWGDRLDAQQLDAVREDIEGNLGASAALRKLELTNADEPDVVFRAEAPGA
jgi:hypothetical protein